MSNRKFYIVGAFILILNCCWLSFYFYNKSKTKSLKKLTEENINRRLTEVEDLFEYADDCPDFTEKTLTGKEISINSSHTGVLFINFFSPDTALRVWKYYKYLSDLVERYKEKGDEVNHVCVSSGKLRDTKNFIKNHNITLDVIIDNGSNLNKLFKLEGNNGVVIVKNGKVDFHYRKSNIDPMLTRQLFEKYFKRGVN